MDNSRQDKRVGLKSVLAEPFLFPSLSSDFKPSRVLSAAGSLERRMTIGPAESPPLKPDTIRLLHSRATTVWRRDRSFDALGARDLRRLPWVFFYRPRVESARPVPIRRRRLVQDPAFVRAYLEWLGDGPRYSAFRALLREFLREYPVKLDSVFQQLRDFLDVSLKSPASGYSDSRTLSRWRRRCNEFDLLDKDGPVEFVRRVLDATERVDDILKTAGMVGLLQNARFIQHGIVEYVRGNTTVHATRQDLDASRLGRLINLLEIDSGTPGVMSLRVSDEERAEVASRLLRPFSENSQAADRKTKNILLGFFSRHFGHPRVNRTRWSQIEEKARKVYLRWIIERALHLFLDIVENVARSDHWVYRRRFWEAFLRRDIIEDIVVVMGSQAIAELKRISARQERLNSDIEKDMSASIARLRGALPNQSVLLMELTGGIIVAEWSHSGACRGWRAGNPVAPTLDKQPPRVDSKPSYTGMELRQGDDFRRVHLGDWQWHVANWVRDRTGICIDPREYT